MAGIASLAEEESPPASTAEVRCGVSLGSGDRHPGESRRRSVITPSISDLAVEFGVARTTIQKATESLRDERVIQTSPMGMFVSG